MKQSIIFFLFFATSVVGQTVVKKSRQTLRPETIIILDKLDSLFSLDTLYNGKMVLEFRRVGEAGRISDKFMQYAKLAQETTETELLTILDNTGELAPVRGYAYMAYAYKCDKEKKMEKVLNYNFKFNTLNGCLGFNDLTFSQFKKDIHNRNAYDPNPKHEVLGSEEKKVIKKENEIRQEQGTDLRKKE